MPSLDIEPVWQRVYDRDKEQVRLLFLTAVILACFNAYSQLLAVKQGLL
ncbi:hypothetical protein OH492_24355 [Vibrio chagasii]|nr:hypothetical protein [Vibrio chagasii]